MLALLALLAAPLAVPESIAAWRQELGRDFGIAVPVVAAGDDILGDPEGFELVHAQLADPGFRRQFALMNAAMISQRVQGKDRQVILLNRAREGAWKGFEEALIGHELGHIWLRARKLPAPAFTGGEFACLAVHTGDVVQHVLIRAEMDRRGIGHREFLMRSLDASTEAMERLEASADSCAWVRQAAIWVDARLAFESKPWPGRDRYEAAALRRFPEAAPAVAAIIDGIAGLELNDPFAHRKALLEVFSILRALALAQQAGRGN